MEDIPSYQGASEEATEEEPSTSSLDEHDGRQQRQSRVERWQRLESKGEENLCQKIISSVLGRFPPLCIIPSVKTEDDFCPPAGDGAPARENAEGPAEDGGPVTPLLLPEDPVTTGPLSQPEVHIHCVNVAFLNEINFFHVSYSKHQQQIEFEC